MLECGACRVANAPGTLLCVACAMPVGAAPVAVAAPAVAQAVRWVETANLVPTGVVLTLPDTAWEGTLHLGRQDLAGGTVVDCDLGACGGREKGVSRRHATLRYEAGVIRVQDWASAQGTYVNKRRLQDGEAAVLADGDEVRLAGMVFRVEFRR